MGELKKNNCPDDSVLDKEPPGADPVILPLQDSLDLHAFRPQDTASVLEEYIRECEKAGFAEIRIIHGKGTGTQRNIVRSFLTKHPAVRAFHDAPLEAGGWGATVVILKRN